MRSSNKAVIATLNDQVARLQNELEREREEKETLQAELAETAKSKTADSNVSTQIKHGKRTKKKEVEA